MNEPLKSIRHDFWKLRWCRLSIAALAFAGLGFLLYSQQNRSGKAGWLKHKSALEARGERLDWSTYIPASIPADQNIFGVPEMKDTFVKGGSGSLMWPLNSGFATTQHSLWHTSIVAE